MMDFSKVLFRCSSLGKIMTEPRSKSEVLSSTCIDELIKVYAKVKYGRSRDITSKYLEKGIAMEEEAITLYSKFKRDYFVNNKARMSNDFITGEWDILKSEVVTDTKCSWDLITFLKATKGELNKDYFYQLHGYMALTGAKSAVVAYCLVNTPENLVQSEIKNTWYKMGCPDESSDEWQNVVQEIEMLGKYDDIPVSERVFEFNIERDEAIIERINTRVSQCRQWMQENFK
jgi:hypothetical protein